MNSTGDNHGTCLAFPWDLHRSLHCLGVPGFHFQTLQMNMNVFYKLFPKLRGFVKIAFPSTEERDKMLEPDTVFPDSVPPKPNNEALKEWVENVTSTDVVPVVAYAQKKDVDIQQLQKEMSAGWKKLNPLAFDYEVQEFFKIVDAETDNMVQSGKDLREVRFDLPRSKLTDGQLEFIIVLRHLGENEVGVKIKEFKPVRDKNDIWDQTTNATRTIWQLRDALIMRARDLKWICGSSTQSEYRAEVMLMRISIAYVAWNTTGEVVYNIPAPAPKKYMLY